ncbi:MAG TPA: hypothetical protein VMU57_14780 [Edaphobacter sp.]|uniref:hypothetical protein n=1 Tax=Edaphobacter sp. TaxID=1934404 RepID=UPI002B55B3D7|nr:hypothetical protein [Edaphobacter sp.]HUZ96169.1 hypothetical protein [Edaphobacter sp.]
MNRKLISKSFLAKPPTWTLALSLAVAAATPVIAQPAPQPEAAFLIAMAELPDAPGEAFRATDRSSDEAASSSSSSAESDFDSTPTTHPAQKAAASRWDTVIAPGQQAPSLTGKDKFLMGARDSVTPSSMAGWFIAAGWSHLLNTSPKYGTDKGAFGQRLGAATIRGISEDILSTSVMAPVFHEDRRYYRMGRHGHSLTQRAVYAATRVFVTKSDSGRETVNLALLTGDLEASALTNAYYPERDRTARRTMLTYGTSLGGAALGFGVHEFLDDALELAHLKKSE